MNAPAQRFYATEAELAEMLADARGAGEVLGSLTREQIAFMSAVDAGLAFRTLLVGFFYQVSAMAWIHRIELAKDEAPAGQ